MANHTSDNLACLAWFRLTCIGIAVVATGCMIFTGFKAKTFYELKDEINVENVENAERTNIENIENVEKTKPGDILKFHLSK